MKKNVLLSFVSLISCCSSVEKAPVLLASRKLPIAWVIFKVYDDNRFFYSGGRGDGDSGTYVRHGDTLLLSSSETEFKIDKVVIHERSVSFINSLDSNYHNGASIIHNHLSK